MMTSVTSQPLLAAEPPMGMVIMFLIFSGMCMLFFAVSAYLLLAARRGAKVPFRKGGLPGQITGATVTAKRVPTEETFRKVPFLALHIEFVQDGQRITITDPPRYNRAFVRKVRRKFIKKRLFSFSTHKVTPLKIADPREKERAEAEIAGGGSYEFVLEEPIPVTVFRTDAGSSTHRWQIV